LHGRPYGPAHARQPYSSADSPAATRDRFFHRGRRSIPERAGFAERIRMMLVYGVDLEQNPIARTIFQVSGPVGLSMTKLTIVLSGVHVLVLLADVGRTRLARYCAHDRRTRGAARVRVEPGLGVDHAACQLACT